MLKLIAYYNQMIKNDEDIRARDGNNQSWSFEELRLKQTFR